MRRQMINYRDIDAYLANFSGPTLAKLKSIRRILNQALPPEAKETISYGIPTFTLDGNLIHFAGYDSHIGFYPGRAAVAEFQPRLKGYKTSTGTIQLPLDKPLPEQLIRDIAVYCVEQKLAKL